MDAKDAKIAELKAQLLNLKDRLKSKDDKLKQWKSSLDKHRKQSWRVQSSVDEAAVMEHLKCQRQEITDKLASFRANAGGISWLTIFNCVWCENHSNAAWFLSGYKYSYVNVYFPEEVDVNYYPSTKDGEFKLPLLTPFKECICSSMH